MKEFTINVQFIRTAVLITIIVINTVIQLICTTKQTHYVLTFYLVSTYERTLVIDLIIISFMAVFFIDC